MRSETRFEKGSASEQEQDAYGVRNLGRSPWPVEGERRSEKVRAHGWFDDPPHDGTGVGAGSPSR